MFRAVIGFALSRRAIILLGVLVFIAAGVAAYIKLNIEAYPNPAPVILEITAQAAGLSAEEMEKYYTTPMEIGLYPTPGIDNIRSTSFYGLSFVRVTFKYGVDYYFAYTQAALSLQQNVNLPGSQVPQIQQSSLVGEVYRYQVVGPPHFGLTNLRTVQDWIALRRLSTVPGVVAVNSWGGTTKEFEVEADLAKLQAYKITVPQLLSTLGNSNVNVGGREITVGQQSVNIRGVGLINDGGDDDLTQGYHVDDIQNIVLGQHNGVPVLVKDVARVFVGYVPRLGIAGRDHDDDVVASIVVMGRTQHTNDVIPRIKAAVAALNSDGTLPPGVKLVPYYDRTTLVNVTTHTVLHNLALRLSAGVPDPVDFPGRPAQRRHRRREHSLRLVLRHHPDGAAEPGRQPPVHRRSRLRHHHRFGRDPGREHLPQFAVHAERAAADGRGAAARHLRQGSHDLGRRPGLDHAACR